MLPTRESPLLIVGTGALACLFAARLSAVQVPVAMLGSWAEGLAALRRYGVRWVDEQGAQRSFPVGVLDSPEACTGAWAALVLVKSWQTERAARQLAVCLVPGGMALTLQNGLGNQEILAHALGLGRTAVGVTTAGAHLVGPGIVRQAGEGVVALASQPQRESFAALLASAGFAVETAADVRALQWGKLVINAAINPLTALLEVPNGELLARPSARELMAAAAEEAAAVARAQGISLPYAHPAAEVEAIARRTASNQSSMLQDIRRGAPTEVDAINGAVVRAGRLHHVPTPVHTTLWRLVKAKAALESPITIQKN